jgi:hypothetical protein
MRVPIGCFVLMAACFSAAQTSQEFHSKYGEPDIERFTARPGISLTVEFGSDGLACHELLEPLHPLLHREEQASFMSSDAVTEVLEEIAPAEVRGRQTGRTITMSGCNKFEIVEYEHLTIARSTHNCVASGPDRDDTEATVTFKRDACRTQRK